MPPRTPKYIGEQKSKLCGKCRPTSIPAVKHESRAAGRAHETVERLALDVIKRTEDPHGEGLATLTKQMRGFTEYMERLVLKSKKQECVDLCLSDGDDHRLSGSGCFIFESLASNYIPHYSILHTPHSTTPQTHISRVWRKLYRINRKPSEISYTGNLIEREKADREMTMELDREKVGGVRSESAPVISSLGKRKR